MKADNGDIRAFKCEVLAGIGKEQSVCTALTCYIASAGRCFYTLYERHDLLPLGAGGSKVLHVTRQPLTAGCDIEYVEDTDVMTGNGNITEDSFKSLVSEYLKGL